MHCDNEGITAEELIALSLNEKYHLMTYTVRMQICIKWGFINLLILCGWRYYIDELHLGMIILFVLRDIPCRQETAACLNIYNCLLQFRFTKSFLQQINKTMFCIKVDMIVMVSLLEVNLHFCLSSSQFLSFSYVSINLFFVRYFWRLYLIFHSTIIRNKEIYDGHFSTGEFTAFITMG